MEIEIIIIIIILITISFIYYKINKFDFSYIQSNIDHNYYLVRDLNDKKQAGDLLATFRKNINILIKYLLKENNKEFNEYIKRLEQKIKHTTFSENLDESKYTSYSINKGEEIVFCLRSKKTNKLHDKNLLMYVVIHEISHIACPEYNENEPHTLLFKKIFSHLLEISIKLNIYVKIDFPNNPTEYCGIMLHDSII